MLAQYVVVVEVPAMAEDQSSFRMSLYVWGTSKLGVELAIGRELPNVFIESITPLPYPSPTLVKNRIVHAGAGKWLNRKLAAAVRLAEA